MARLREVLGPKAADIAKVLSTPAGETLIKALEDEYVWGDLQDETDRQMHYNHGARDVVLYLRGMQRTAARLGDSHGDTGRPASR